MRNVKKILCYIIVSLGIVLAYAIYDSGLTIYNKFFHIVNQDDVKSLHDDYYNFAPQKQLTDKYKKAAFLKRITASQYEFWLLYISSLIETSENYKAVFTLWRYIRGMSDLEDLYRFLNICNFATKHGFNQLEIEKSARIFRKFEDTRKKQILYHLLKGKTVALVGNGPYEIGKKSGKEIDAHDIVIRMNNYVIEGFEEDYGKRTDIWIYGFGGKDIEDKSLDNEYLYVGMTGDYTHFPLFFYFQRERLYRDMFERKINIGTVEPSLFKELHNKYDLDPSTGLQIIYTFKQWNIDFDVYGFAFLDNKVNKDHYNIHYYHNDDEELALKRASWHNYDKEFELFAAWFEGRHIKKADLNGDSYD